MQVIFPWQEAEPVYLTIDTLKFNRQGDISGCKWLVPVIGIHTELRRHAAFKDGHLEGKRTLGQQAPAMWAAGRIVLRMSGMIIVSRVRLNRIISRFQ